MNQSNRTRKLALAGLLTAVAVVGGMFSIPIGAAKCSPVQHMVNVIAGVLIMGMLGNGMTLMNLDEYWQWVTRGAVLLFAVAFDNWSRKRQSKVKA